MVGLRLHRWAGRGDYRRPGDEPRRAGAPRWLLPASTLGPALLWLALTLRGHAALAVVAVPLLWLLAALATVDLDVHRLPDRLQLPAYPLVVLVLAGLGWATGDASPVLRSLLATVLVLALGGIGWLLAPRQGLGLGDVKLAGLLAAVLAQLGWSQVLLGLWSGLALGGATALLLVLTRRMGRRDHLALGPPLIVGAVVTLALG
ncbi:hypothetical protein ADJ73_00050 [Arsenicicoccus sp. oral taxon 190]|nr:hypothetical protein ADJ73_00050 [Arsenicicoccus sp. oral taxon 190]